MPPGKAKNREARSRNTTPLSTGTHETSQPAADSAANLSYDDLIEKFAKSSAPPPAVQLKRIAEALKICSDVANAHANTCNHGMREMSRRRKDLLEQSREMEMALREEEERKERQRQLKLKQEPQSDTRPLATGAHSLAPQDGTAPDAIMENGVDADAVNGNAAHTNGATSPTHTASSEDDGHQPRPAPPVPQFQTFGPDPLAFDDPTIYHIRDIHDGLTEDEKKEILSVAHYPHDDLHDLTPGTPPDRDFSNAKPPNQVTVTAFINYLEPYVRPLVQEDVSFLEERGERLNSMIVPRRGSRGYKEVWAAEDTNIFTQSGEMDGLASHNQPSGSIDEMNDDVAETNNISAGPMTARLLSLMRPEPPTPDQANGETNGDITMNGTGSLERDGTVEPSTGDQSSQQDSFKPPTFMPESQQAGWKTQQNKQDFTTEDERVRQELIYIGFLPPDAQPDFDGHHDDEVAARLRYLQEELQRISVINGARKAKVQELAEERMAVQEWSTIADDLDTQINQAYLKRHRNIGKSKGKLKKPSSTNPGGAGVGVSKPSIGEPIRALMNRRIQWSDLIGPVVNFGRTPMPEETIFEKEAMEKLMAKERELWAEAQDQA